MAQSGLHFASQQPAVSTDRESSQHLPDRKLLHLIHTETRDVFPFDSLRNRWGELQCHSEHFLLRYVLPMLLQLFWSPSTDLTLYFLLFPMKKWGFMCKSRRTFHCMEECAILALIPCFTYFSFTLVLGKFKVKRHWRVYALENVRACKWAANFSLMAQESPNVNGINVFLALDFCFLFLKTKVKIYSQNKTPETTNLPGYRSEDIWQESSLTELFTCSTTCSLLKWYFLS